MEFIEYSKKYKQDLEYFYETFVLEDKDINVDSLKDHFWENFNKENSFRLWLAKDRNKIIGFFGARAFRNELYSKKFGYSKKLFLNKNGIELCSDYILPEYRGYNLQKQFIKHREKNISGIDFMAATILENNIPSKNNYFSSGYYEVGNISEWPVLSRNLNFVLVVKDKI